MRRSLTVVLEQNETYESSFDTEPYEVAWASEARWFVRVLELTGGLTVTVQVSPDGMGWCDEGHEPMSIDATGLASFAVRDFGPWLRLRCALDGTNPRAKVLIYLALKE